MCCGGAAVGRADCPPTTAGGNAAAAAPALALAEGAAELELETVRAAALSRRGCGAAMLAVTLVPFQLSVTGKGVPVAFAVVVVVVAAAAVTVPAVGVTVLAFFGGGSLPLLVVAVVGVPPCDADVALVAAGRLLVLSSLLARSRCDDGAEAARLPSTLLLLPVAELGAPLGSVLPRGERTIEALRPEHDFGCCTMHDCERLRHTDRICARCLPAVRRSSSGEERVA